MKAFEYAAPHREADVLELLSAEVGRVEILAGGTDLIGLMKKMVITPDRVVNIMEVPSLKTLEPTDTGGLCIGATVTLDELLDSPYLDAYPAIAQAIRGINSMQLQCQGTIGGEICQRPQCWYFRNGRGLLAEGGRLVVDGNNRDHAILGNQGPAKFVSSSRIAPALIALDAQLRVIGPDPEEETWLPAAEFFRAPRSTSPRENVLGAGQLLTHIELPAARGWQNATYEVRHGAGPEFPMASAAAAVTFDGPFVREARIVLGQVAPTPWLSREAAETLRGLPVNPATAEAAGEAAVAQAMPLAQNGYKVQLAKVAVKRAVLLAAGQETGGF